MSKIAAHRLRTGQPVELSDGSRGIVLSVSRLKESGMLRVCFRVSDGRDAGLWLDDEVEPDQMIKTA